MTDYDNNLTGVLFKNDEKRDDKDRDYNGSCEIEGRKFWISAWINTSKQGRKFMKLKFKAQDEKPAAAPETAPLPSDTDDGIPF